MERKSSTSRGSPKIATPSPSLNSSISLLTLPLSEAVSPHQNHGRGSQQNLQGMLDRGARLRELLGHREQRTGAVAAPAQPLLERTEGEVATPHVTQTEQIDEGPLGGVETDGRSIR